MPTTTATPRPTDAAPSPAAAWPAWSGGGGVGGVGGGAAARSALSRRGGVGGVGRGAAVGSALARQAARIGDALLAPARPAAAGADALALRPRAALRRPRGRGLVLPLAAAVAAIAFLVLARGPAAELEAAFRRALAADWGWVAAGMAFEAASFAGYVAFFWLVAGAATRSVGLRESAQISLSGAAATRLLPTAGLGGAALSLWALARAGLRPRAAVRALLTFLVVLYGVFMAGLALSGTLLVTGVAPGGGPAALMLAPAAFGLAVIVSALWLARARSTVMGLAAVDAIGLVRRPDPRVLGAVAWWGFDLAVLAATFEALGAPPPAAVLALAYFTGAIGNTIPLPGMVAGGTMGVLVAFGVDASLALPAVFAYRAIALWLPALLGTFAVAGLRRTVARWTAEGAAEAADDRSDARPPRPAASVLRVDRAYPSLAGAHEGAFGFPALDDEIARRLHPEAQLKGEKTHNDASDRGTC